MLKEMDQHIQAFFNQQIAKVLASEVFYQFTHLIIRLI